MFLSISFCFVGKLFSMAKRMKIYFDSFSCTLFKQKKKGEKSPKSREMEVDNENLLLE